MPWQAVPVRYLFNEFSKHKGGGLCGEPASFSALKSVPAYGVAATLETISPAVDHAVTR